MLLAVVLISCGNDGDDNPGPINIKNVAPNNFKLIGVANESVGLGLTPEFSWETAIECGSRAASRVSVDSRKKR